MCSACAIELARDVTAAFPTFVAHHQDLVFGVARRSAHDQSEAEDLGQDAFIRAFRALQGYEPARIEAMHLRGWLARVTLNLARNRARDRGPRASDLETVCDRATTEPGPERVAEARESTELWRRLLAELPPTQRQAVELRHVHGLSYPELAEALSRRIGTVKSDVHRGVERLRRAYEAEVGRETGGSGQREMGATGLTGRATATVTGSDDGTNARGRLAAAGATPEVMIR